MRWARDTHIKLFWTGLQAWLFTWVFEPILVYIYRVRYLTFRQILVFHGVHMYRRKHGVTLGLSLDFRWFGIRIWFLLRLKIHWLVLCDLVFPLQLFQVLEKFHLLVGLAILWRSELVCAHEAISVLDVTLSVRLWQTHLLSTFWTVDAIFGLRSVSISLLGFN